MTASSRACSAARSTIAELGASGYAKVYLKDPKAVTPILTTRRPTARPATIRYRPRAEDLGHHDIKSGTKGKKLGYADPDSTSGYLIPLTQIPKDTGASNEDLSSPRPSFSGGHENNLSLPS